MATAKKTARQPDVQLIANTVITDPRGRVLLTRYDDDAERWWLPGAQLRPYEDPEAALQRALDGLVTGTERVVLHHVESFRGRRGWHVMLNLRVKAKAGAATADGTWFRADALPPFAHGRWEPGVIGKALA